MSTPKISNSVPLNHLALRIKADFPILQTSSLNSKKNTPLQNPNPSVKPLVYLDSTATTQKPTSVIDKEAEYYLKTNANVHRGLYSLAEKATMEYEDARNIIADFIHALPEETIFTSGTTGSLNLAAMLLSPYLREGDEIVVTIMEHHSNFLPWQQLAQRKKCLLKIIPLTSEFSLDLNAAKAIITAKTKILACSYVSNVLGVVNPVKELIQLAKKNNAYTIIDAAQAIPHFKIDVQELGCDFLAFSGHKMLGPTGIGILYGRKSLLTQVEPVIFGGEMVKEASLQKISWNDLPWKFEAGTPNIAGAIALGRAVEYLQSLPSDIHEHLHQLTDYAIKRMENIPSLKIIGPTKSTIPRISVISFTMGEAHPHDIADILNREGVCIRAGHHCTMPLHTYLALPATARASLYIYNTKEDVDLLINALEKVRKVLYL